MKPTGSINYLNNLRRQSLSLKLVFTISVPKTFDRDQDEH